jgi:hypothetical protein
LIIALAALTLCVFAATASAAPTLTVSGASEWTGYYLSNPGANSAAADAEPKSFGTMITVVSANLAIAQNLFFRVSWEGHDRYWGSTSHKDVNTVSTSTANSGVDWNDAVMTYISPYGIFIVGTYKSSGAKVNGSGGELAQWGLQGSHVGAYRNWGGSFGTQYDMLIWSKNFSKALNLRVYGLKYTEHDAVTVSEVDGDVWQYSIRPTYNWKTGGAYVDVRWSRVRYPVIMNASGDWYSTLFGILYQVPVGDGNVLNATNTGNSDWYYFYLGVAQKFGPVKVGWNSEYKMGKIEGAGSLEGETWDTSSFKYYLEAVYASGPIEAGACFSHTHLSKLEENTGNTLTVGTTFRPLYAFYSKNNVAGLGNDLGNHNLLAVWFDYNVIKNLWLHVAYGYLQWSNTELYSFTPVVPGYVYTVSPYDVGKTIGSEIDFGLNYTVAKGLDVGLHFGYFMPAQGWEDFMTLLKGTTDSGASYLAEAVISLAF